MKLEQAIQSTKFKSEIQKAGLNILYTAWWLKTVMSRELKEFGLTHEQYNVLRILNGKTPAKACVKDIACRMIEKNSNVPRIIDRLEIKKLVKRLPGEEDARQTMIVLTQAGKSILDAATVEIDGLFDKLMALTNAEAASINELMEKVRQNEG